MEQLTSLLALLAALSLATERITELIKGLPVVSRWLAIERARGSTAEEFRKASIHPLAIAVGTFLARLIQDQLSTAVSVSGGGITTSAVTVVNDTTVTATFTIAAGAGLTARNLTVTTNGITSNLFTAAFTVN